MAKVEFYCNSGANAYSCKKETFDTVKDLGMRDGEWEALSGIEKMTEVEAWANDFLDIGYVDSV